MEDSNETLNTSWKTTIPQCSGFSVPSLREEHCGRYPHLWYYYTLLSVVQDDGFGTLIEVTGFGNCMASLFIMSGFWEYRLKELDHEEIYYAI